MQRRSVVEALPAGERKRVQESLQQLLQSAERVLARRQEKT
jgi:hypothetical protein